MVSRINVRKGRHLLSEEYLFWKEWNKEKQCDESEKLYHLHCLNPTKTEIHKHETLTDCHYFGDRLTVSVPSACLHSTSESCSSEGQGTLYWLMWCCVVCKSCIPNKAAILKLLLVYLTNLNGYSGVVETQTVDKRFLFPYLPPQINLSSYVFFSIVSFVLIIDEDNWYTSN